MLNISTRAAEPIGRLGNIGYPGIVRLLPILRTVILLLGIALAVPAYVKRYLPLTEAELSLRFPQHLVRKEFLPLVGDAQETLRIGSITVRFLEPNRIQFSGTDLKGKRWTVTASEMMGGALYSADLDHNGTTDLIYACHTGGNGWAPSMQVLTLLFDKTGRPIPSEMDGYFEIDERGLKDLLDLDGDGRAELIRQAYDDGYWITSAYEARDAHWHRLGGEHGPRKFPIYTRFTNRTNRVPTTPAPGRHPTEDDLSNDTTVFSGQITAVHWANIQTSENPEVELAGGVACRPVAWYSSMVVVLDTPNGRTAATLGASEEAHGILDAMMKSKVTVEVKGQRRYAVTGDRPSKPTRCVPETIWGSEAGRPR